MHELAGAPTPSSVKSLRSQLLSRGERMEELDYVSNISIFLDAAQRIGFCLTCLRVLQKQLEAIKQLQEDAVNQEGILGKRLQEASQWLEDAKEQGKDQDREAHSASEKATSLLHKLEEAISEQRKLQTINTELSNTCQALQQKTRKLKTTIESLQKRLIEGEHHGLLFQSFLDEEFPHYVSLSCTDAIQQPLQEKLKQRCHKLYGGQEARIHQTPLTLKHTCWYTPLLDALSLDSFTAVPTLESTPFSGVANQIHTLCERPTYGEVKDGALDITRQHKCPGPTSGPNPGTNLSGYIRMNDDPSMEENGVERVCSESLLQSREYSSLPLPRHTSSTDSTITSSDPGLEILNMASCDLDSNSLCKKEEDTRTASPMTEAQGTNPAHDNTAFQDSASKDKTILNLKAKEEPETIEEHKKERASGEVFQTRLLQSLHALAQALICSVSVWLGCDSVQVNPVHVSIMLLGAERNASV
ncbi:hypothetical protein H8959_014552 [Pygathrix nigripes]